MTDGVTPLELLGSLGLLPDGPVLFSQPLPSGRAGVYLIEWPLREARAPIEHHHLRAWLERVQTLRLDGERPTPHELAARLGRYWLPTQTIVYIGQTTRSLRRRLADFAATPLGDPRPHAGGYWLKTLRGFEKARVWWAETDAPEEYEDALLEAFGAAVGAPGTLPFANLTSLATGPREHGITGAFVAQPAAGSSVVAGGTARTGQPPRGSAATGPPPGSSGGSRSRRAPGLRAAKAPPAGPAAPGKPAAEPIRLTADGLARLRSELTHLREMRRPEVIARVRVARELGDLRENAEYHAAREEQSFLEGRIQQLQATLDRAILAEAAPVDDDTVRVGSTVDVEVDGEPATYRLVDPAEARIAEGRLSYRSPIGAALLGKRAGDEIGVTTPAGHHTYRLLAVR